MQSEEGIWYPKGGTRAVPEALVKLGRELGVLYRTSTEVERLLIAPYWVNYHAEHHLFMYLPCYRLPETHRLLVEKGLIKRMEVRPGYLDVMRLATSSQRA